MYNTHSPLITAKNLGYCASNGTTLVENISIDIGKGEVLALAGPNGAGKTTLLKMLSGLLAPTAGSLKVFGHPIGELTPRERAKRIAIAGQNDIPDSRLTLFDYVSLGRIPHNDVSIKASGTCAITQALELTRLTDLKNSQIDQLSGGERQRAMIARAICQEPEILFLDEPTNHLDPKAKRDILRLVAKLGITVIVVMHDLTLIPGLANRILFLQDGAPFILGDTETALTNSTVKSLFDVDYHWVEHPDKTRSIPVLDLAITQSEINHISL